MTWPNEDAAGKNRITFLFRAEHLWPTLAQDGR